MDKDTLEKRIKEYQDQQKQLIGQAQMLEGAIADSKYWLEQLEQPKETKEEE